MPRSERSKQERRESTALFVLLALVAVLLLLVLHFWASARYLESHCSLIPDNMLEVPDG